MELLLGAGDMGDKEGHVEGGSAQKRRRRAVLGRVVSVSPRQDCPLAFPESTQMRLVMMISLKKNEHWIREQGVPWLFERLRSENALGGVPLIDDPDADRAAVAAPSCGTDSQDSLVSPEGQDSQTTTAPGSPLASVDGAGSAQGTVDVGYKCVWLFPTKGNQGAWEATVTRAGDLHGNVVACAVSKFTKAKWLRVYSGGREPPCQWGKATPLQKKEACKLYLESHMDALLSEPPQEAS